MATTQGSNSDMGPPPSTPKRFSGGTHTPHPASSSVLTHDQHSGHPLPTPPTSHLEDFHSPTHTATPAVDVHSFSATGAGTPAGPGVAVGARGDAAGSANDRTPTFARMPTSPRAQQIHNSRLQQTPTAKSTAFARANPPTQTDRGTYTYDDAYTRSRTPSPILPRLQPVPEASSSTGDGHLTFPPFGVSQSQIDAILHDPATDRTDPSLMHFQDIEGLVMSVRKLTVDMANTEDVKLQQLVHSAKTLGEQALGYAHNNASLRSSLNNTRIHALSAINALNASASHSLAAERDLRQRLQVELDGERAQSRMLAGKMGRTARKHEEEQYGADGSGSEATETASPSELLKERNKLIADRRFLKNRVKEAEGQVLRLEQELKALRPHFVRAGFGSTHGQPSFTSAMRGHGHSHSHGYISDPFALGSNAPILPGNSIPSSPLKKERGILASQSSSSQRRRRAATLGDTESEHLILAARRYREVHRRAETAAQEMADRAASVHHSNMPVYYPYHGYVPPDMPHTVPSSPGHSARAAVVAGVHAGHASASASLPPQYGGYQPQDAREGNVISGQSQPQVSFALGGGGGPNPFDPHQQGANTHNNHPAHLSGQRPISSSASMGVFGNSYGSPTAGFGNVGPTPRTPPPMHDRLPRGARTEGSISRIRSIPSSPRGSPSTAQRGTEWYRSGSVAGLGTASGSGAQGGGPGTPGSASLQDLLHAAQTAFRPGQEGRAMVQSRIQHSTGRRSDLRGLGGIPSVGGSNSGGGGGPGTGASAGVGTSGIAYEHDEDDNDSLPYSEDESGEDDPARRRHADDDDIGDESFAKKEPGSPKRRRTSAALNSPSKRMAKGRSKASVSASVPGSPSKDRTPRPPKGGGASKASNGGGGGAGLSALDLLADQAAASSTQSQYSGDSGSEHHSQGGTGAPLALGGGSSSNSSSSSARRFGGAGGGGGEEEGMDVEPTSPRMSGVAAANASHEKRSTYTRWSAEEDTKLRAAIKMHGQRWELVSRAVETRSYHQCRQRYLLLRRKEAAKSDGTGGGKAGSVKGAVDGNGNGAAFIAPGLPSKSSGTRGHGGGGSMSGSRSGRSNSEGEEIDEIEEEDETEIDRDEAGVEVERDELLSSQAD